MKKSILMKKIAAAKVVQNESVELAERAKEKNKLANEMLAAIWKEIGLPDSFTPADLLLAGLKVGGK